MALEDFYRGNYRIVFGYLLSLCGNTAQAEDLASETFLRALRNLDGYDGRGKPSTWLCAIARNLFLNECRRQRCTVPLDDAETLAAESFEERYLRTETAAAILAELRTLTPDQRQVFFMRLSGLRFREIGEAVGRSENWARVTYFRAKSAVLERLEGYDETL